MKGRGFHWFVAMRYLRGPAYMKGPANPIHDAQRPRDAVNAIGLLLADGRRAVTRFVIRVGRHGSRSLQVLAAIGVVFLAAALVTRYVVVGTPTPKPFHTTVDPWIQRSELAIVISAVWTVLMGTLLVLRAIFSFFSTVSIAGVWIGTMALVFVLSVMGGFESDLRQKILGSNAHIQVSREEGDFTDWEDVQLRIAKVPGVVASTPFAVSEVVIAANNNYFNVIIKGIDPDSIGKVTQLFDDIQCGERKCTPAEAKEVIAKLLPLIPDETERDVPQKLHEGPGPDVVDRAPDDMVDGTEPEDFSGGGSGSAGGSGSGAGSGAGSAGSAGSAGQPGSGGPPGAAHGAGPPGSPDGAGDDRDDDFEDDDPTPGPDLEGPAGFGGEAPRMLGLDAAMPSRPPAIVDPPPIDLVTPDDPEPEDFSGGTGGSDDGVTHTITISSDNEPPTLRTKSLGGVLVGRELTKQIHLYPDLEVRMVSPLSDPANPDATGTPIPFHKDYRVAGVFFTGMYEYDLKFVYVTLESLQRFLDRGDAIDGLEVRTSDADDTSSVVAALQKALGKNYRVQDWQELNRSLFSALKLEKIAMFLVLAIIILVASFSIVGNLVMVVVEKGKEIALLKTLGASDRGVTWIFVTQGFFIGAIGTALGVIYGLIGCVLAKRFGIPINPDVYYIDRLPIHVDLPSVLLIASAGMLISVGATLYPALVAARLAPSVGLRH